MHAGIENKLLGFGATEKFTYGKSGGFNGGYLSRTFTTSPTWTFSAWVKRSAQGSVQSIFGTAIGFDASDHIVAPGLTTTAVFRDPTAWYHIYVSNDGLYVNGVYRGAVTTAALTNPLVGAGNGYLFAMLNEVHFVDGAVAPLSRFGLFDNNGVWTARKYTASHGAQGFYLDFSTATADASGNGNNFTANGTVSIYLDSPALNCAVMNAQGTYQGHIGNNGFYCYTGGSEQYSSYGTLALPLSGKYAFYAQNSSGQDGVGVSNAISTQLQSGKIYINGNVVAAPGGSTNTCLFALDVDNNLATYGLNGGISGTWNYTPSMWVTNSLAQGDGSTATGQYVTYWTGGMGDPYTLPAGYKHFAVGEFPAPDLADPTTIIRAVKWTGTGAPQNVIVQDGQGRGWQPDLVIIKCVTSTGGTYWFDTVRGPTKYLSSAAAAAQTVDPDSLTAFNVDGFTVGANLSVSGAQYIAYCFKKRVGFFDIVSYTGTAAVNTVPHGLGKKPAFGIFKAYDGVSDWPVYHQANGASYAMFLNYTQARDNSGATSSGAANFNSAEPTASQLTVGASGNTNLNGKSYIAYLWGEHDGVQRFRGYSYSGWGSAGYVPAVAMNISAQILLVKGILSGYDWTVKDTALNPDNPATNSVALNTTTALYTGNNSLDLQAAGIKFNGSGSLSAGTSYVYAAWALQTLGGDGVHCATAR